MSIDAGTKDQRPKTNGQKRTSRIQFPSKIIVLKFPLGGVIPTGNKKSPGTVKKNGTEALTKVKPM